MYRSPLRYPGGKAKLAPFMEVLISSLGHPVDTYIEPFAGGAGIAIELLQNNFIKKIVINDYDKGIYSFWRAILTDTDRFVYDIETVPLTMEEWDHQRSICLDKSMKYSYELGFATFYMNRTNRSGIIKGGVIGGYDQNGKWKLDARFNREKLIKRIVEIAKLKSNIYLYNKDIASFITNYLPRHAENAFVYFDPPYYEKGKQLYLNFFSHNDHLRIKKLITESVQCDWIITYDDITDIASIYQGFVIRKFDLSYSASTRRGASEIMIFKNETMVPAEKVLMTNRISINLRKE